MAVRKALHTTLPPPPPVEPPLSYDRELRVMTSKETRKEQQGTERRIAELLGRNLGKEATWPRELDVHGIVVELWNIQSCQPFFKVVSHIHHMDRHPAIAWKVLGILYRVASSGHPGALHELYTVFMSDIRDLGLVAAKTNDLFAKAASQLSQLLVRKVAFHSRYPNFTGKMAHQIDWDGIDPAVLLPLGTSLLDLQQMNIMCVSSVLNLSTSIHSKLFSISGQDLRQTLQHFNAELGCLLWPLVSVINDTGQVYLVIYQLVSRLAHSSARKDCDALIRLLQVQHKKLIELYDRVFVQDFLKMRCDVLNLSPQPPSFDDPSAPFPFQHQTVEMSLVDLDAHDQQVRERLEALRAKEGGDLSAPSSSGPRRWTGQFLSPILGRRRAGSRSDRAASPNEQPVSSSDEESLAGLRRQLQKLKEEKEEQKVVIASLNSYMSELTQGLTAVDPDVLAAMQADALGAGESQVHVAMKLRAALQQKLQRQEEQISQLKEQLEAAQQELDRSMLDQSQKISQKEQDVASLKEKIAELESSLSSLQSVQEDTLQYVKATTRQLEDMEASNASLKQQLAESKEHEAALDHTVAAVRAQLEEQTQVAMNVQSSSTKEKSDLQQKLEKTATEVMTLRQGLEDARAELKLVKSHSSSMDEENDRLRQTVQELETSIDMLNEKLTEVSREYVDAMQRELDTKKSMTELKRQDLELKQKLEQAEQAVMVKEELLAAARKQVAEATDEHIKFKESSEAETQRLRHQLETSGQQLLEALQNDETASKEVAALQQEVLELRSARAELTRSVSEKEQQMQEKEAALTRAKEDAMLEQRKLALQVSQAEERIRSMSEELKNTQSEMSAALDDKKSKISGLEAQLKSARTSGSEKDAKIAELTRLVSVKEEEAKTQASELETRTADISRLEALLVQQHKEDEEAAQQHLHDVVADIHKSHMAEMKSRETAMQAFLEQLISAVAQGHEALTKGAPETAMDPVVDAYSALSSSKLAKQLPTASYRLALAATAAHHVGIAARATTVSAGLDPENLTADLQQQLSRVQTLLKAGDEASQDDCDELVRTISKSVQQLEQRAMDAYDQGSKNRLALEEQLDDASKTVDDAVSRMAALLERAKAEMNSKTLAVHSSILDASMALMNVIQALIQASTQLQEEIVSSETSNKRELVRQFYKRNSRWVDGLASASKAVGAAATELVDTADGVLTKKCKFEQLMVCGQEITASTVQLVSASRVKARPDSEKKERLEKVSKEVSSASRKLIEAARQAAHEENVVESAQDYLQLTLTQAKRLEMDSQIRVLELETQLLREQERLRQLRKAHYHLSEQSET